MINDMMGNISARLHLLMALNRQKSAQGQTWRDVSALKILLITEKTRIPQSQIFPFYFYARQLRDRWNVEFKEINIDIFESHPVDLIKHADRIFFQPWLVKGERRIVQLLDRIKKLNPEAKIVFFDTNAPTDLRFAETVNPYIDFYVKKHALANRLDYSKVTFGDTRLIEYYNRLCRNPEAKQVFFPVSQALLDKLVIGPSFFTSREMLPFFARSPAHLGIKKKINLNARLQTKGSKWFTAMRERAIKACLDIPFDAMLVTDSAVTEYKNRNELKASRICFSPFGYGEVCWRDFEAILCGALLIKPDMSHVETHPNIFIPFKTYVPISWDFSDLDDKVTYYLENEDIATTIVSNAYKLLHDHARGDSWINQYARLFE